MLFRSTKLLLSTLIPKSGPWVNLKTIPSNLLSMILWDVKVNVDGVEDSPTLGAALLVRTLATGAMIACLVLVVADNVKTAWSSKWKGFITNINNI